MSDAVATVTTVDHVYVAVRDLDRAEPFYDDVMRLLGARVARRHRGDPGERHRPPAAWQRSRVHRLAGRMGAAASMDIDLAERDVVRQARTVCRIASEKLIGVQHADLFSAIALFTWMLLIVRAEL